MCEVGCDVMEDVVFFFLLVFCGYRHDLQVSAEKEGWIIVLLFRKRFLHAIPSILG